MINHSHLVIDRVASRKRWAQKTAHMGDDKRRKLQLAIEELAIEAKTILACNECNP